MIEFKESTYSKIFEKEKLYGVWKDKKFTGIVVKEKRLLDKELINSSIRISNLPDYLKIAIPTDFLPHRWKVYELPKLGKDYIDSYTSFQVMLVSTHGVWNDPYFRRPLEDRLQEKFTPVRREYITSEDCIYPGLKDDKLICLLDNSKILDYILYSDITIKHILTTYMNRLYESKYIGKIFY